MVVSNRVPAGGLGAGGLAVGLRDALVSHDSLWFGWSGRIDPRPATVTSTGPDGIAFAVTDLTQQEYDGYYAGYSNRALWPAFHYRLDLSEFHDRDFIAYRAVNERLADTLAELLRPGDVIWIHDYHLLLLAQRLREQGLENPVGFFSHVPFPSPEVFQAIPQHQALLAGLMAHDLIGFQSERDRRNFDRSVLELGNGLYRPDGSLYAFERLSLARAFPIGLNIEDFTALAQYESGLGESEQEPAGPEIIIGVDRMDYSKGIPQRIQAIDELLDNRPDLQGKITYLQITPPTREDVDAYANLRGEIEALVGRVNGANATLDWSPIRFVANMVKRDALARLYRRSRVGLVTPLRDGMNLVAKEYVACQDPEDPGVLVLSEFAGAAEQLQDALIVNPHDVSAVARAIERALEMPLDERRSRHRNLMTVLEHSDARAWSSAFLEALRGRAVGVPQRFLTALARR